MNNKQIKSAIQRSEMAYELYLKDKLFFQALRIFKANEIVYKLLQDYQLVCPIEEQESVCYYIFHLEDWMIQFEYEKLNVQNPNAVFVFERWEGAISFQKLK